MRLDWVYPRVCGGTIVVNRFPAMSHTVYPRVCGGTARLSVVEERNPQQGLSPRVRGNP